MGAIILWMAVTLEGHYQLIQDRFESVAACEAAVDEFRVMASSAYGMSYKNHRCIPSN